MGFFNRRHKNKQNELETSNVTVTIRPLAREYYYGPTSKDINPIIDKYLIKTLYEMLPDVASYYQLTDVNGSHVNGYIREKKIKKNQHTVDGIAYDYYPFFVEEGAIEVDEMNYITLITAKGTRRKMGKVYYKDVDKFKNDIENRRFGLYIAGGPAIYIKEPLALESYWRVYAVFAGSKSK